MTEQALSGFATHWQRAPKDGSLISIEFSDGEVVQACWDLNQNYWLLPRPGGDVVVLHQVRHDLPQDWWPVA
jgi:hypothetical protein